MIYTVAKQEGYGIDVESTPGSGASFRITLPLEPARQSPSPQTRPIS
jgi:signal transduction histidine kinase